MTRDLPKLNRVVVKVGSSSLCHKNGKIDPKRIEAIAEDIASLIQEDIQVVLVSSGAVAAGRHILNENETAIEIKQAAAAIGQIILLGTFQQNFRTHDLTIAQILLTHEDLQDRRRYLSARNTLVNLLDHGIVPIINENFGSYIHPTESKLNSRKAFIAHALKPKAKLIIDQGAANAIRSKKASLLPSGILETEGAFLRGDGVICSLKDGLEIARGIVEYDRDEIVQIAGQQSAAIEYILGFKHHRGIIHRENMVIIKD